MSGARWIALGALWMGAAVVLGAFGSHALHDRLVEAEALESWRTGVRYQAWHALALVLLGLMPRGLAPRAVGWLFLAGSALFSVSIYGLALGCPGAVLGPVTPVGGTLLIVGWGVLAWSAWRRGAGTDAA